MEAALGYEKELNMHVQKERAAVKLSSHVGELLYDKGVELVLFRNHLTDITISEILNLHEYAKNVVKKPIDIETTAALAEELLKKGIYVIGFFFPVVPKDKARIRVQLSAAHTQEHLDKAISAFTEVAKNLAIIK